MTFFFFNSMGVVGVILGGAVGWACLPVLRQCGIDMSSGEQKILYGLNGLLFGSALFSLFVDRCEIPNLIGSYRANIVQFCYSAVGQDVPAGYTVHSGRRLAFFAWPLAIGPLVLLVAGLLMWIIDAVQGIGFASNAEYATYLLTTCANVVVVSIVALVTGPIRLIPAKRRRRKRGASRPGHRSS